MPHSPLLEAPQLRACQRVPKGVLKHICPDCSYGAPPGIQYSPRSLLYMCTLPMKPIAYVMQAL